MSTAPGMPGAAAPSADPEVVAIVINGAEYRVPAGISVCVALLQCGVNQFRASRSGEPRGPVCGMGVCHECRVTINGQPYQRSCMVTATAGMRIETGALRA